MPSNVQHSDVFVGGNNERRYLKPVFRFLWKAIMYTGHAQASAAVSLTYVGGFIAGLPVSLPLLAAIYAIFEIIYIFDRWHGLETDAVTNKDRTQYLASFGALLPVFIMLYLGLAVGAVIVLENGVYAFWIGAILFFGLIYPIIAKQITVYIPLFKNGYVALVFALLVFIPASGVGSVTGVTLPELLVLAVIIFVTFFCSQILFDTKDVASDKVLGLRTLPVIVGTERAVYIVVQFLCMFGILVILAIVWHVVFAQVILFLYGTTSFLSIVLLAQNSPTTRAMQITFGLPLAWVLFSLSSLYAL